MNDCVLKGTNNLPYWNFISNILSISCIYKIINMKKYLKKYL